VSQPSHIRVYLSDVLTSFVFLYDATGNFLLTAGSPAYGVAKLAYAVPAGSYYLKFRTYRSEGLDEFCTSTLVQLAVTPTTYTSLTACPSDVESRLPDLARVLRVPGTLQMSRYYATLTDRESEAAYTFKLEEEATIDVYV
jgi:hypothetical protein